MANPTIKLLSPIYGTDKLEMSDHGTTCVNPKKDGNLEWKTVNTKQIKKFRILSKCGDNPFEKVTLPTKWGTVIKLKVKEDQPKLEWEYQIDWIGEYNDAEHHFDPKISINPSPFNPGIILSSIICSFIAFFSLQFLFKRFRK